MLRRFLFAAFLCVAPTLAAQNPTDGRIAVARKHILAHEFPQADTALTSALDSATYLMDSVHVFVWRAILEHLRGSDTLARNGFRNALTLYPALRVNGLDQIAPGLDSVFESELRRARVYAASDLDEPATWRAGPALVYPADLRRRRVAGQAVVVATVDTSGHVEAESFRVLEIPDSEFIEPLRQMMLAATFAPGRVKGHAVRSRIDLSITLKPPAPERHNPTALLATAREQLRVHHADSALVLAEVAVDSINNPTAGERVYALLVRGMAQQQRGRDSLATVSFDSGLAGYRDLTARGIDLAPFLKRLADSIRLGRRSTSPEAPFAAPTAVGAVDAQPALVTHPAIRYAPEMQALRIGGTVVVEATLDTSGHVVPATARVVQSPNHAFDAEATRVVAASVYRPAKVNGKPARVTIRQAITFAAY